MSTSCENELKRKLTNRHIQMISLGGAIGTGIFYASSKSISDFGPSLLLAYLLGGIAIFVIMRALGEMAVYKPVSGSFSQYAYEYMGDFAGFFSGWNFWFTYVLVGMVELTAAGKLMQFWWSGLPTWVTALTFLIIMTVVNLVDVKAYGEFEFWFAIIKVITISLLIVLGVFWVIINFNNPNSTIGIQNLWIHGGFFSTGIKGLLFSLVLVMFSFGGVELVGIAAGEATDPQKIIPKAINQIIWRILLFYIASLWVVMMIYPWNQIDTTISPFVQIFSRIGISSAATIINIVVVTAALSAYNSGLYSNGRALLGLARQGNAPKKLACISKSGVPVHGILVSSGLTLCAVILNYILPDKIFIFLVSIVTVAIITNWVVILLTHLKFRKSKTKREVEKLKFKLPLYPLSIYFALAFLGLIVVLMAFLPDMRYSLIIAPVWFSVLCLSYRIKQFVQKKDTPSPIIYSKIMSKKVVNE